VEDATSLAGVPGLLVHGLRRTGARKLRGLGVDRDTIMRIGGWKTDSVFRRYNIVDERDLQGAADALGPETVTVTPHRTKTGKTANHCWQGSLLPFLSGFWIRSGNGRQCRQRSSNSRQFCRRRLSSGLGQRPVWLALEERTESPCAPYGAGLGIHLAAVFPGRLAGCLCPLPTREPRFAIRSSFSLMVSCAGIQTDFLTLQIPNRRHLGRNCQICRKPDVLDGAYDLKMKE
jgi:hypothetical protein